MKQEPKAPILIYRPGVRVAYESKERIRYGVVTSVVYNKKEKRYYHNLNCNVYRKQLFKYEELRIASFDEWRFY